MQRRIIPREIKNEIVAKVKSGEKVLQVAGRYGVSDRAIYDWLQQDSGEESVSPLKYNKLKKENEELKRLIGELTLNMSLGKKN